MERTPHGSPELSLLPLHDQRVRLSCSWKADPEEIEMIEEYLLAQNHDSPRKTNLLLRKWRKNNIKGPSPWIIEIGSMRTSSSQQESGGKFMVQANSSNPQFIARDSALYHEFIVINIPYPKETYSIMIDDEKQQLVLRTSNKKFFKRWQIEALVRRNITLEQERIQFSHENTTLFIKYKKTDTVLQEELEWEGAVLQQLKSGGIGGGDHSGENQPPECKTS